MLQTLRVIKFRKISEEQNISCGNTPFAQQAPYLLSPWMDNGKRLRLSTRDKYHDATHTDQSHSFWTTQTN